ncbi:InlB B-repeat-containing protein, partial [Methanimicrococcus blatticola]|nr:InlB B-repeat-containing protein [Methanimicrococcus blatticola]
LGLGDLSNPGFAFDGWEDQNGVLHDVGSTFTITENMVLTAQWEISTNTFTVTYVGDGTELGEAPVDANSPYAINSKVTVLDQGGLNKLGSIFIGWKVDGADPETIYKTDETFIITADTVLIAQWEASDAEFTVTYNVGDGTGVAPVDSDSPYTAGSPVTVLGQGKTMYKDNYIFVGWKDQDGNERQKGDIIYINKDMILTAQWQFECTNFKVTYTAGEGGLGTVPEDLTSYGAGSIVTVLDGDKLRKPDHVFNNWKDSDDVEYVAGSTFYINGNTELIAQWKPYEGSSPIVTFHENNVSGQVVDRMPEPSRFEQPYGSLITKPINPISKGYAFVGWYEKTGDELKSEAWDFNNDWVSADVDLYAKWDVAATYTVTYYPNGADGNPTPEVKEWSSDGFAAALDAVDLGFTKADHIMLEWNTQADGLGDTYHIGETLPPENLELYAQWNTDVNRYYILYYPNGADNVADVPVKIYYTDKTNVPIGAEDATKFTKLDEPVEIWSNRGSLTAETYTTGQIVDMSGEGTFTELDAVWDGVLKVTFHADGGEFTGGGLTSPRDKYTVSILHGTYISDPTAIFLKAGVTLNPPATNLGETPVYWVTSDGVQWIFDEFSLDYDMDLYAVWNSADLATVTYNAKEGEFHVFGVAEPQKKYTVITTLGSKISDPSTVDNITVVSPARYVIAGWYNGTTQWNFNTDLVEEATLELSAIWKLKGSGGGTGEAIVTMSLPSEEPKPEPEPEPEKDLTGFEGGSVGPGNEIKEPALKFSHVMWLLIALICFLMFGFVVYRFGKNKV